MKSTAEGETHVLPITTEIRALVDSRRGQHPVFVFTYQCLRTTRDRKGGIREAGKRYPFSDTGWRKVWKRALEAAGIKDLRFHDARHTCGTRSPRPPAICATQRTLGHKNIATTMRYAHVLLEDVAAGIEAASRNLPEERNAEGGNPRRFCSPDRQLQGKSS